MSIFFGDKRAKDVAGGRREVKAKIQSLARKQGVMVGIACDGPDSFFGEAGVSG